MAEPTDGGASARREYERRHDQREQAVRAKHPKLGGAILALQSAPQHETAWARGAEGERLVAGRLEQLVHQPRVLLHDRRGRGRGSIDHLAVVAGGVWVIDTKRYRGTVEIRGGLLRPARLIIAGRDKTDLAVGLRHQLDLVAEHLAGVDPTVPVRAAFCFLDADLPMFATPRIDGFALHTPRGLARQLNRPGPLDPSTIARVGASLSDRFGAA